MSSYFSVCLSFCLSVCISSWMQKLNEYLFWDIVKNKLTCCSATKTYRTLLQIIYKGTLNKRNCKWKIDKIKRIYKYIKHQIIYHKNQTQLKPLLKYIRTKDSANNDWSYYGGPISMIRYLFKNMHQFFKVANYTFM